MKFEDACSHKRCAQNLNNLVFIGAEKCDRNFNWRERKKDKYRKIYGFSFKQYKKPLWNIFIKFQNPRCSSSWKIFDANSPMHYTGVRDGQKWKNGQINLSFLIFFYTTNLATLEVLQHLKNSALIAAERSVTKSWLQRKKNKKQTNKRNDKPEDAGSLLHSTFLSLYQISNS